MAGPHYVTKLLLSKFKGPVSLLELDKKTGIIEPRGLDKAGAEVGIWPDAIEKGPMQQWDTNAHRLLRATVWHNPQVLDLDMAGRRLLNEWLFIYVIRSPANRALCQQLHYSGYATQNVLKDRKSDLRDIHINRSRYLENARHNLPELYAERVKRYGRKQVDNEFIFSLQSQLYAGAADLHDDPNQTFHNMLTSGRYEKYLKVTRGMNWTWLHSQHDLVIGDNPYCRSKAEVGGHGYGIGREDLEIFFPLDRNLCLWMHRRKTRRTDIDINYEQVTELNRRQIHSAVANAFGPSEEALTPWAFGRNVSPIPLPRIV